MSTDAGRFKEFYPANPLPPSPPQIEEAAAGMFTQGLLMYFYSLASAECRRWRGTTTSKGHLREVYSPTPFSAFISGTVTTSFRDRCRIFAEFFRVARRSRVVVGASVHAREGIGNDS